MTFPPPGERIDGTTAECAHLHLLLACFRASPPPKRLPEVTGRPLPDLLGTGIIDAGVFSAGYDIMAARYEQLGIRALLPLERVWTGTRSAAKLGTARSHGGFHHPAQGYRHIQMDAAVTVYGDLTGQAPMSPQAVALDLVRSYAHDCLHYATFRRLALSCVLITGSNQDGLARVTQGTPETWAAFRRPGLTRTGHGASRRVPTLTTGARSSSPWSHMSCARP